MRPRDKNILAQMYYREGKTLQEIGDEYNVTRELVRIWMESYNLPRTKRIVTEETRRKISKAATGKKASEETRRKMSKSATGQRHTEETKEKLRQYQLEQYRLGKKGYWTGKKMPQWIKDKIRKSQPRGAEHSNWKGGTSQGSKRVMLEKIRKRDNHWCLYCRDARGEVVHHMLPDRLGGTDDETNLVTLCRGCHGFIESKIIS